MRGKRALFGIAALLLVCAVPALAQGQIDGTVTRDDGKGVGGVTVVVSELGMVEITGNDGAFSFRNVPDGNYNISFSLGENADSTTVEVSGGTATVDQVVDWDISFAETITVYSASRRRERIVDAPAAVTIVSEQEVAREASSGQLAKVIEFAPGVEVTQSGIHDFNLNMRGFNSSLNRRVQVIVDGRDPSVPFLGSTEWNYLSNMSNMASVELVRGPSSALYGANAFNGVLNLITKAPADIDGGRLTLTGGDLSTLRGDFGWGGALGSDWFAKIEGQYTEGDAFTRARTTSVEYAGLPFERVAAFDEYDSAHINVRFDKQFANDSLLSIEGGTYDASGGVTVTGIGRVNLQDSERNFFRLNYSTNRFNILAYHNDRESPDQIALASGGRIFLDSDNQQIEFQGNGDFNDGKIRVVGGASYRETSIDTANFQGRQTLTFSPVENENSAVFAQADFDINDKVKLVLAGRYDESDLHDSQFSPKAALVVGVAANHTLRFSYNEAFQVANYSEFFLDAPTVIPGTTSASVNLGAVEGLCGLLGVSCGFNVPTPVRALGNVDLELEEITAFEVGYSGIFGSKAYLTIDYYSNELENFITDLTANAFGSINPNFGPYRLPNGNAAPALVQQTLAGALGPLIAFLSNNVDGSPVFALASYTNAGAVDTQGVDLGLNYYIDGNWVFDFTYSWFDFDVKELGVLNSPIIPNAPENKWAAGITYNGEKWGGSLKYRWVEEFEWEAGAFAGPVPDYSVVNLSGNYNVNENITIGLNVSNLLEDEHWESFGGDILERRALGYVTFNW